MEYIAILLGIFIAMLIIWRSINMQLKNISVQNEEIINKLDWVINEGLNRD